MSPEVPHSVEKNGSAINLAALSFYFCSEEDIRDYYAQKLHKIEQRGEWMKENSELLQQEREKINKAVEDGLIADDRPETIWQFQIDKIRGSGEGVVQIRKRIEEKIGFIREKVAERLGAFLPEWTLDRMTVNFAMNDQADFCIDDDIIVVDLGRLLAEHDFIERVISGVAHEVFHIWMSEETEWSDSEQDKMSDQALRERVIFKTADEGLAVFVSGQSLVEHHEKQGRNYSEYIQESFKAFNDFLGEHSRKELERIKDEEFENMGHFYVVGNAIAKSVLQYMGIERFKEFIKDCRHSPARFFEEYRAICEKKRELPQLKN